jgi:hypothetical protein
MRFSLSSAAAALMILVGFVVAMVVKTSEPQTSSKSAKTGHNLLGRGPLPAVEDESRKASNKIKLRSPDNVLVQIGMNADRVREALLGIGATEVSNQFSDTPRSRRVVTEDEFEDSVKGIGGVPEEMTLAELNQILRDSADRHGTPLFAEIAFWELDSETIVSIYSRGEIEGQLAVSRIEVFPVESAGDKQRRIEVGRSVRQIHWKNGSMSFD